MVDELTLVSKADILFQPANIVISQPSIKDISFLTEDVFYTGCNLLTFSKNSLYYEDKVKLNDMSDFNIIMSVMNSDDEKTSMSKTSSKQVLELIFPKYKVTVASNFIALQFENQPPHLITQENYSMFSTILTDMFCLKSFLPSDGGNYNPQGFLATKIADKIRQGKEKIQQQHSSKTKISVLSRYVQVLAAGEHKDINELVNYSVYQLFTEFRRFNAKEEWYLYVKAKMAGAQDIKEPKNWMSNLLEDDSNIDDFDSSVMTL